MKRTFRPPFKRFCGDPIENMPDPWTLPGEVFEKGRPPPEGRRLKAPYAYVTCKGDDIFVVFNKNEDPQIPVSPVQPVYDTRDRQRLTLKEMMGFKWEVPGYPYLAFLPIKPKFNSPFLSRLAVDAEHIPIDEVIPGVQVHSNFYCHMAMDLVKSWVSLEECLLHCVRLLKHRSGYYVKMPTFPNAKKLGEVFRSSTLR